MSYPDNATASLAQFLFRDSQGAMYIIPRRAFHNGSQYGDTVTIVQDLSGNGNDLTGTAVFDRKPFFYVTDQESLDNIRDAQIIRDVNMAAPVGNLGPGCTVVRVEPGWPVDFAELAINGNYQVTEDFSILIIIDRALTEPEVRVIEEMGKKWGGATFNPLVNYANGEQGAYYAPWDISTLWQDDARTVPVENYGDPVRVMDDLSPNGNHAVAPTSTARGTYGRMPAGVGRRNLLTHTEDLTQWNGYGGETAVTAGIDDPFGGLNAFRVVARASLRRLQPPGSLGITGDETVTVFLRSSTGASIRFFPSGNYISTTNEWHKYQVPMTETGIFQFRLRDNGDEIDVFWPQVEHGPPTPYQRVGNEYDVSQEGVPDVYYIETDGIDDCYQTESIDLTMYDSTSLAVGVQNLVTGGSGTMLVELSGSIASNDGSYNVVCRYSAPSSRPWAAQHRGTTLVSEIGSSTANTEANVLSLSGSISEPDLTAILQGELLNTTASQGTGNLGDYELNLFSRNASSNFFRGRFFGAIIVHPRSPYEEQNRQFLAMKAGVTL